jgi:hypothetical protein
VEDFGDQTLLDRCFLQRESVIWAREEREGTRKGETDELGVEFCKAGLACIVEDQDSIDHFARTSY